MNFAILKNVETSQTMGEQAIVIDDVAAVDPRVLARRRTRIRTDVPDHPGDRHHRDLRIADVIFSQFGHLPARIR